MRAGIFVAARAHSSRQFSFTAKHSLKPNRRARAQSINAIALEMIQMEPSSSPYRNPLVVVVSLGPSY